MKAKKRKGTVPLENANSENNNALMGAGLRNNSPVPLANRDQRNGRHQVKPSHITSKQSAEFYSEIGGPYDQ